MSTPTLTESNALPRTPGRRLPRWCRPALPLLIVGLALAVRIPFFAETNSDYTNFLDPWYTYIDSHGGFAALKDQFANYNVPYLYLLAAVTYLPIPKIVAVKLISVVFDLLLAYFGYRLVALRFTGWRPAAAAAALLAAPTVIVNGAYWGQCDSIYAAFCLAGMYFLLRRRPVWAGVFLGLAVAFKLQAVFIFPVAFVILLLQRPGPRRVVAAVGAVVGTFAVTLIPALAVGASLSNLLSVYPDQITGQGGAAAGAGGRTGLGTTGTGRGGQGGTAQGGTAPGGTAQGGTGQAGLTGGGRAPGGSGVRGAAGGTGGSQGTDTLTRNAPSFYQWLPTGAASWWRYLGLGLTALSLAAGAVLAWVRRRRLGDLAPLLVLTCASLIAVPFLLPDMHERYFYLADVFTIVTSFYVRRFWPVAVLVQVCSFVSYAPFLWNTTIIPLDLAAVGELGALVWTLAVWFRLTHRSAADGSTAADQAVIGGGTSVTGGGTSATRKTSSR